MEDYKVEIENTRKGCLGGSDGYLLQQVATMGYVPRSAYKRLAIVKGFIENEHFTSRAMQFGDYIEQSIYRHLSENDDRYESNPLWVSKKYSKKNCKLICHPDFVLIDKNTHTINCYECKATKFDVKATKETYRSQMFIEWLLANEIAEELGRDWKVQVILCHYDSEGLDLDEDFDFNIDRLSLHKMAFKRKYFDVNKAMTIIDAFLDGFNEYYDGDEIESKYLPERIKNEFDAITNILEEIKERECKVSEFKEKLYKFMVEKEIKSIKNDTWSIVRVDGVEIKAFDGKKYLNDLKENHPRKAKKIINEYTKVSKRNGYVQIKLKNNK